MKNTLMTGGLALAAALVAVAGLPPRACAEENGANQALERAYHRELCSHMHYIAFKNSASQKGYPDVEAVFAAAAFAESVHAASHLRLIECRGGKVVRDITSVVVFAPAENLRRSIENERIEEREVYRAFEKLASQECDYEALDSFRRARGAEATHAAVFVAVLDRLNGGPGQGTDGTSAAEATPRAYFVCPGCGRVFQVHPEGNCPGCGTAGERFRAFRVPGEPDAPGASPVRVPA